MDKAFNLLENKLGKKKTDFIKELYLRFQHDNVTELGAQITYYLILAIFPFLIFLLSMVRYTPITDGEVIETLLGALPDDSRNLVGGLLEEIIQGGSYALLSFGAIAGIWSASNGIMAMIKGVNRAYDLTEERPFWKLKGLSILLTIGLSIIIILAFVIVIFGEVIFNAVFDYYTWPSFVMFRIFQVLGAILLIGLVLALLYKLAPSIKEGVSVKYKDTVGGGFFAATGLLIFSMVFSFYVNNFVNYTSTYGSIGGIIILLIWFYVSSIVIVLGAEVNATRMSMKENKPRFLKDDHKEEESF